MILKLPPALFLATMLLTGCAGVSTPQQQLAWQGVPGASGNLVIVGGGPRPDSVMRKIIDLSADKSILIIPMASAEPEQTGLAQQQQLLDLGAREVNVLILSPDDHDSSEIGERIANANGIWFSGGDQNRLMDFLGQGVLLTALHDAYQRGAIISGTSAGAAVMSRTMITGDERVPAADSNFAVMVEQNVITSEGIGFLTSMIVDQHFIMRNRLNRLISVLLDSPESIAAGIDEATALWCTGDGLCEVIGESQVVLLVQRQPAIRTGLTATYSLRGNPPDTVDEPMLQANKGMEIHILPPGSSFMLTDTGVHDLRIPGS